MYKKNFGTSPRGSIAYECLFYNETIEKLHNF